MPKGIARPGALPDLATALSYGVIITMSRVVLITANIDQPWVERLKRVSPDLVVERRLPGPAKDVPNDVWQEVEVLYTFSWTLPSPEQVPGLRWTQLYSAGADRILDNPLFQKEVTFTTASGVHAITIAEYVLAMTQSWFRQIPQMLTWQQQALWPSDKERWSTLRVEELNGKTIGIVGYGSIGRQVAKLSRAYGMRVLAMQRGNDHRDSGFPFPDVGDPEGTLPERYYTFDDLHPMLKECDIVVIAVPLTPQTKEMFNEEAFQAMKETAFLVNIARGEICDEQALIHALQEKHIAGAALDVFQKEPLPPASPLWHLPNVFISPHIAGFTPHYNERAATIFEENLRRYLSGESLYNIVDKGRGY